MLKIHLFFGGLTVIAILMAGCESYNLKSLQAPGSVDHKTGTSSFPGGASTQQPGTVVKCGENPDFQCGAINTPAGLPPKVTPIPFQTPQTHSNQSGQASNISEWLVYKDSEYHYQIDYPPELEFKVLQTPDMAKLNPQPVSVTNFSLPIPDPNRSPSNGMSPGMGVLMPPVFSIRIYDMGSGTSLENWLQIHGLYLPNSGWTISAYHGSHFSGYKVTSSLYMAPGWFIVAVQGEYLYQLIPLGNQSEAMLSTFEFTS